MCLSCCVATGKFRLAQFRQQKAPVPRAAQGGEEAAGAIRRSLFRPQDEAMGWPFTSSTVCESGRNALKTFDQSFARMTLFFWLHVAMSFASNRRSPALKLVTSPNSFATLAHTLRGAELVSGARQVVPSHWNTTPRTTAFLRRRQRQLLRASSWRPSRHLCQRR